MKDRIVLILKGMCMGLADVIPGVSGGTMALVLGIYTRLINAVKSVDHRYIAPAFKAVKGLFRKDARGDLVAVAKAGDLPWLMTLAFGIGTALVIGSRIIPTLMERYPEVMFAFFFGLVLASVSAPWKMLQARGARELGLAVGFTILSFFVVGESMQPPIDYKTVEVQDVEEGGQTLKMIALGGPSALPPEGIYWDEKNQALRDAVPIEMDRGLDPKRKDNPYNDLVVPAGTSVHVPAPAVWFVFIAGFIAICAMVLPGISGSFILLLLGSYYFILNALKGFLKTLASFSFPTTQTVYVAVFCVGALLGLIVMTRFLSWLLQKAPTATMASLIGVMLGSLRAIWPFKTRIEGSNQMTNVAPSTEVFGNTVYTSLVACVVGIAIVAGLSIAAKRLGGGGSETNAE